MLQQIDIDGVHLTLATPDTHESHWIDYNDYLRQLGAAWLRLTDNELPLNPRIVGEPGLGKTTLACPRHFGSNSAPRSPNASTIDRLLPQPSMHPLPTLRCRPCRPPRTVGVDADRYSFIVSDLHRLLFAGLSGAPRKTLDTTGILRLGCKSGQ